MESRKNGIGTLNEKSLHAQLKDLLANADDKCEVKVGRYFIDIVRDDLLIEIQTGNFGGIRRKLGNLLVEHRLRLVYPIAQEKIIRKFDVSGRELSVRKSPKRCSIYDLFTELVYIPEIMGSKNFELEVILLKVEEIRCADGGGSWRRKGVSIVDRKITEIVESRIFRNPSGLAAMLEMESGEDFTNKQLASKLCISRSLASKITYTLRKMNALKQVGKSCNAFIFRLAS